MDDREEDLSFENEVKYDLDHRGHSDLERKCEKLKKDLEKEKAVTAALYADVKRLKVVEEDHMKLNGKLRLELSELETKYKKQLQEERLKSVRESGL